LHNLHVLFTYDSKSDIFQERSCVPWYAAHWKGAFELGCTICPIAIKYNKIFIDLFWNNH
ncbi:hypothetical protein S83_015466, partial [Arachis hypogaea]